MSIEASLAVIEKDKEPELEALLTELLLVEVCASLWYQREAVTHLTVTGGTEGVLSTTQSHLYVQLITYSPVLLINEPKKSILFYAKYHLVGFFLYWSFSC